MNHIAHAFDRAADYDAHARVQRHAAHRLAERIAALPLPPAPRILEIGCGTGFLSEALLDRLPAADALLTDIAPAMLARCRDRLGDRPNVRYCAMDGEAPDTAPGFDLICSSFTFQWFADPAASLPRLAALLRPGGRLAFATMLDGSLAEWHAAAGEHAAMPDYPDDALFAALGATITEEIRIEQHPNAHAFLASLRAIGAHRPRALRPPVATLRPAMRAFEAAGSAVTWRIGYGIIAA
jgi:malonyl-CoA O-methyltransferase